ncbi:MAG: FAD-dependent oxidoreductase [Alphaproteobacteria bacterium]|nr:FAD-dependent oxidoreductase [Alphaproteobacteria bacterium]
MSREFTIIGAGVAGLCVATELVSRGAKVALHDTQGLPGPASCSWWAGGMLAPFCEGEAAPEAVVRLGRAAAGWWQGHGVPVTHNGTLVIALGRDRQELDRFARRTKDHSRLDAPAIAALEPDLGERFSTALFYAGEAHLAPREALSVLAARLAQNGVAINTDAAPPSASHIDCRGLAARDSLRDLRGVKGEMLILRCPQIDLKRPVRLLHPRIPIYLVPRGDGVYMLGATQIESNDRNRATVRSVLELLSAAYALHPAFGEAEILEVGVDARPAFPDNVPRVIRQGGVVHANGLFRHGFLLAPALAGMVADHVLNGARPELFHEYHP